MSNSKTILIVEDEMIIALHIEQTLVDLGHRVITATSKAEAERLAAAGGVDLAIVDYQLTDGTTERLMERLQEAGTPFIVCSGMAEEPERPVTDHRRFLSKPFSSDALIDAVLALTQSNNSDNELADLEVEH